MKRDRKGFSLVEILIISTMLGFVISLVYTSGYSSNFKLEYIHNLDSGLNSSLRNSQNGYGGDNIFSIDSRVENNSLFDEVGVYLDKGESFYKVEMQKRYGNNANEYTRIISRINTQYSDENLFLESIVGYNSDNGDTKNFDSLLVSFKNPFGNISFFTDNPSFIENGSSINDDDSENTINEFSSVEDNKLYDEYELYFVDEFGTFVFKYFISNEKDFYPIFINSD